MADFTALKTAIQNAIKQNGNEEITGNLLQDVLLAIVTTLGEGNINNLISALNAESNARQLGDSTLQSNINTVTSAITSINYAIANGCVYAGIATPTGTPATGRVFYLALTAGTYTNYGNKVVTQGINILRYNGSAWSLDVIASIDDAPTPSSNNLIKSGGAFDFVMTNGSAFDLTAYNNGTTYADLNAALTALNALPAAFKKGGMSMKFVQTSDNNYVQYRCIADDFTTDVTKWAIDYSGVYVENPEFDKCETDSNGNMYLGVRKNGQCLLPNTQLNKVELLQGIDSVPSKDFFEESPDWARIFKFDKTGIVGGLLKNGYWYFPNLITNKQSFEEIYKEIDSLKNEASRISTLYPTPISMFQRSNIFYNEDVFPDGRVLYTDSEISEPDYSGVYRLQGGCMDYSHNNEVFFVAGNKTDDDNYSFICVTKSLSNFAEEIPNSANPESPILNARFYYGTFYHCNDLTFNPTTNKLYVALASGINNDNRIAEFSFNYNELTLEFIRFIEVEDAGKIYGTHTIEYIPYRDIYVIGDYANANIYDANFSILQKNVFRYPESVIDSILGVSANDTNAQSIFYFNDILYKVYSVKLADVPYINAGAILGYDMDGNILGYTLFYAPTNYGHELECIFLNRKKNKIYFGWDGGFVAFSGVYLGNAISNQPTIIKSNDDIDNMLGYGSYTCQNRSIAETIGNYPVDIMTIQETGDVEYHGFTIETKPLSIRSVIQYFYSFKNIDDESVPVIASRIQLTTNDSAGLTGSFTEWREIV